MHFYVFKMAVAIAFPCENAVEAIKVHNHRNIFFPNLYGRTLGPRGVKESEFFFTYKSIESLPYWLTKHKE